MSVGRCVGRLLRVGRCGSSLWIGSYELVFVDWSLRIGYRGSVAVGRSGSIGVGCLLCVGCSVDWSHRVARCGSVTVLVSRDGLVPLV